MTTSPTPMQVAVGDPVTSRVWRPTTVQLFRFSAVTWNPHRIHYDRPYAESEGYSDVLVQGHLHGCFLVQTVLDWAGPGAQLLHFGWQNRRPAIPGDVLTCRGEVTAIEGDVVTCQLEEVNQRGEICAPATATVRIRNSAGGDA